MKNIKSVLVFLLTLGITLPVFAQTGGRHEKKSMEWQKQGKMVRWLDLTKDQQKKIKQLRLNVMKQTLPLKNQLREERAQLQTQTTGENADFDKAENTIDKIASLRADIAKKRLESKKQLRDMLTEEQRLKFDSGRNFRRNSHFSRRNRYSHHNMAK